MDTQPSRWFRFLESLRTEGGFIAILLTCAISACIAMVGVTSLQEKEFFRAFAYEFVGALLILISNKLNIRTSGGVPPPQSETPHVDSGSVHTQ
jgi:hypothetical protein